MKSGYHALSSFSFQIVYSYRRPPSFSLNSIPNNFGPIPPCTPFPGSQTPAPLGLYLALLPLIPLSPPLPYILLMFPWLPVLDPIDPLVIGTPIRQILALGLQELLQFSLTNPALTPSQSLPQPLLILALNNTPQNPIPFLPSMHPQLPFSLATNQNHLIHFLYCFVCLGVVFGIENPFLVEAFNSSNPFNPLFLTLFCIGVVTIAH